MTDKCQWVESQLEAYFSETMDPNTRADVEQHVADCSACQMELDGYANVDALVAAHFKEQVVRAENRVRPRVQPLRLAGAVATFAVAIVAVWIGVDAVVGSTDNMPADSTGQSVAAMDSVEDVEKAENTLDAERAKPEPVPDEGTTPLLDRAPAIAGLASAESRFYVQDAAGHFHTLEDFSGSVLVLGVVDNEQVGTTVFADAYETYGSDPDLRFLGIAPEGAALNGFGFPSMVNRDSALLETGAGEFTIVAPDGTVYARGALEKDELSDVIAASLDELLPDRDE